MSSSLMAALPSSSLPPLSFPSPSSTTASSAFPSSSGSAASASSAALCPLVLKVRCVSTGDCRRFPLPVSPPLSFPALLSCVSSLFCVAYSAFELQWRDEDGDWVTVASEDEWQRLQRDARDRQQRVLQLSVVEVGSSPPHHPQQSHHHQQQQQQQPAGKLAQGSALPVFDEAKAPTWQLNVQSILGSHTTSTPSLDLSAASYPRERDGMSAQKEQKDAGFDHLAFQRQPLMPLQPQQQQQHPSQPQSAASTPPLVESPSSAAFSDDESPVLIDGSNLPSASDSRTASALWKRHKYKAHQSQIQRRNSSQSSTPPAPTMPTAHPVPPNLSLSTARSTATAALKRAVRPQQLTAPLGSSSSPLPSSPLSRSPPSSSLPSPSPLQASLSQHLERARLQLRSLLPTSLTASSSSPSDLGARSSSKATAFLASEREQNARIAAAYDLLASFIAADGSEAEDELVTRDEILSRCIALFVYNEKYLSDKQRRNDELASQLGHDVEINRREEEETEADARRQLLNEAQRHGLRSLSSSVPISSSCSPALVTVMAIIHRHLQSRVVTDVPATLELFGAVLADLTAQVQREENREVTLKQAQLSQQRQQQQWAESEEKMIVTSHSSASSQSSSIGSDAELLSSLSRLPAPLRDGLRALLADCVRYAESAVRATPALPFASISPHSFSSTLQAFRTDYQDVLSDELLREQSDRFVQRGSEIAQQQHSEQGGVHEPSEYGAAFGSQPQHQLDEAAAHSLLEREPQLFDVGRGDVMLSDKKILKAVAKAIKKEQKEQRKEKKADEKRRRRASKNKSTVSASLQERIDDEEHELHELLSQMNNTRQQSQQSLVGRLLSSEPLATPAGGCSSPFCGASCQCHSAASPVVDGDGWQLHPQPQPVASPVPTLDTSSPFAFQPFPYTLSNKQQHQQTASAEQLDMQVVAVPVPHLAVAAVPLHNASPHPAPPSDPLHFPSLPFSAPQPHSAVFAHPSAALIAAQSTAPRHPATPPSAPQPSFASVVSSNPSPPPGPAAASASGSGGAVSRRLQCLLDSLHVMGFKDDALNTWLLQRNGYDLNQTVEWLIVQSEVGLG